MPPEEKQTQTTTLVENSEWEGPWGSIAPVPQSIETLCIYFEKETGKPRIYYYPYRTIGKWNWSMGTPEILEIQLGGVQLTISGNGLRRLAEALNSGQLRLVQLNQLSAIEGAICIKAILIEDLKV